MVQFYYWIQDTDNAILNFIQLYWHNPVLDKFFPVITWLGEYGALWVAVTLVLLLTHKYRNYGIMLLFALILVGLTGEIILKPLIARMRPCNFNMAMPMLVARPTDYSCPSGHTSSSFAAVVVLWKANRKFRIPVLLLAVLIAFSRMYLYVHYPSDVLAGLALGLLCGITAVAVFSADYRKLRFPNRH